MTRPYVPVDSGKKPRDAHINRLVYRDTGKTGYGRQVKWTDYGEADYTLWIKNTSGLHIRAQHASSGDTLLVRDDGVEIGSGATVPLELKGANKLLFWKSDNSNSVNLYHSGTNDVLLTDDSFQVAGAIGINTSPSALGAGDLMAKGNLSWMSGTAGSKAITLDHAATADRTVTYQDLAGTVALLGASNAGHLIFTDNTYDIGASGATRPRNLYLSGTGTFALGAILGNDKFLKWRNAANSADLNIMEVDGGDDILIYTPSGQTLTFKKNDGTANMAVITDGGGIQVGAPTGGDPGSGSINVAGDVLKNNTAYANPDFGFEAAYTGKVRRYVDNMHRMGLTRYEHPEIEEMEAYTRKYLHFPWIDSSLGLFAGSERVLLTLEVLAVYLFNIHARLKRLEGAHA